MPPDKKLHASGEDYLEAVLVLQKEKGLVRSVDVARHMGVSKPSVCHAVATLKEGGFLTMDGIRMSMWMGSICAATTSPLAPPSPP